MFSLVGQIIQPAFCPRIDSLLSQVGIYSVTFFWKIQFGRQSVSCNSSTFLFVYFQQPCLFWFFFHISPPDLKVIILFLIFCLLQTLRMQILQNVCLFSVWSFAVTLFFKYHCHESYHFLKKDQRKLKKSKFNVL